MRFEIKNLFFFFCPDFHIVKCEFRRNRNRDTSIELQPLGEGTTTITTPTTPTPTVTNNEESKDIYFLRICHLRLLCKNRSSGMYSYTYDHMIDRIVAFFSIHLSTDKTCTLFPGRPQSHPPRHLTLPATHPHPPQSFHTHYSREGTPGICNVLLLVMI